MPQRLNIKSLSGQSAFLLYVTTVMNIEQYVKSHYTVLQTKKNTETSHNSHNHNNQSVRAQITNY